MADPSDTLNIGSIRLENEYAIAQAQFRGNQPDDKNPRAAAAARARIAALPEGMPASAYHLGVDGQLAPTAPTADLVTDKAELASRIASTKLVHRRKLPTVVAPMLTAAGVFLLVLLLFKAPIIISQITYTFSNHSNTPVAAVAAVSDVIPAENTITIPKINVHAPVNYEPSIAEAAIQTALQTGVVHYGNTASPGQNGNVAIFGHSSNDWWEPGNFKFVFVLLDKLSPGDQITIDFQSQRYVYEVTGSRVVEPTDVAVLNPTATPTLTLITCSPPGTSLRRLVVTAKQISPSTNTSKVAVATPAAQAPAALTGSPSFLDQVGQAFNGVFSGISSLFGGKPATTPSTTTGGTTTQSGVLPAAQ